LKACRLIQFLQTFRQKMLDIFPLRADALFELADVLLLTLDPRSPVELSASPAFQRRFSMVYDALRQGQVDPNSKEGTVPGHPYSWLGRVIAHGQSWFAPRDVEQIATSTTPAAVAAEYVRRTVRLSAWAGLHFKDVPALVGPAVGQRCPVVSKKQKQSAAASV